MATADRRHGRLDLIGRVMVEMGGESAGVEALGDRIVVELAGLSSLRRWSKGRGGIGSIRRIHDTLNATGLTLEVVAGGRVVGRLGSGARPGLASKMLGLGPLEILLGGILGSFSRRGGRPESKGP